MHRFLPSAAALALMLTAAHAQDTRTVTEPSIPPSCVVLNARLQAVAAKLPPAAESTPDTLRIQHALDTCPPGHAVELKSQPTANAFLSAPLDLRTGVTLLIDGGVTLFASSNPADYEIHLPDAQPNAPIKCGTAVPRPGKFGVQADPAAIAQLRRGGCRPFLLAEGVQNAAIMGGGIIDGRGDSRLAGHPYSWWQLARQSEPHDDIYYSTKLISIANARNFTLYRITLHNAPNYHVIANNTDGFTAWGVHLQTPVDKRLDARNTDGIDPSNSTNITIEHSWIDNGDDNIAVKSNVQHMSVLENHFYSGHGMSIGSETNGQAYLLVDTLTEDHTSSGIRIKSNVTRGGLIHNLVYKNICMTGVPNPIAISPYYTNQTTEPFTDPGYTGTKIPDYKSITLQNIHAATPGNVLIAGIDAAHATELTLDNVTITGITPAQVHMRFDRITLAGAGANFTPTGEGVQVTGANPTHPPAATACANKFIPMQ